MAEQDEMARIRAALQRAMDRKGIKAKPLSQRAGLGETAVRDIFDPARNDVKMSTLRKLADTLEVEVDELIGSSAVAITGRIGAGGSIIFEGLAGDDTVPRPPGLGGRLEALEVIGESMLPRYSDGDVIYISRAHDGVLPEYIGEYCAVRLISGETYVKQLARGSRPGFYTLRSLNAADIEDVELEWATPVIYVLPRFARRSLGV